MIDDNQKKNQDQNQDDQKGGQATYDGDLRNISDDTGEMESTDRPEGK